MATPSQHRIAATLEVLVATLLGACLTTTPVHADSVTRFVLVDATADTDLFDVENGTVIDLSLLPSTALNIRAETDPDVVGSVRFDLDGVVPYSVESVAPYALEGDSSGDYNPWTPTAGMHTLTATPFTGSGATGTAGDLLTVTFEVVASPPTPTTTPPVVSAGADRFPFAPESAATLSGSALPSGTAAIASTVWTQTAGLAATIVDPGDTTTSITGLQPESTYRFRLTATDSDGATAFDEVLVAVIDPAVAGGTLTGEAKEWHRVTVTFDGPASSEDALSNPFRDYRLDVSFTHGDRSVLVPGYFAADGNAAESGATSGTAWRVQFMPDAVGEWSYVALLRTGADIAMSADPDAGSVVASVNGAQGSFMITATDAALPDVRARGLLQHVGERYLRFAGDGSRFLKGGADSPENFLAFSGFDGTFDNNGTFLHDYAPHIADWQSGDPQWNSGDGHGIIGAINYLSSKGMNSIYFLTMNVAGDGDDVWPWTAPTERFRFDTSKLDQWEIVFSHMTAMGMQLHVITQETENDQLLDGGDLDLERRLYYRELVARFAHHPALVWNLGEENTNTDAQRLAFSAEIRRLDPYDHPINVHTYPSQQDLVWTPLLGEPTFEVGSIQTNLNTVHEKTLTWISQTTAAGRPWAVCLDEIGPANDGVVPDASDFEHDEVRRKGLWGNLMAGGAGCEWYFGYSYPHDDLDCEDWRSRDHMWELTRHALDFFHDHTPFWEMQADDSLVTGDAIALAQLDNMYVVYLPSGQTTDLTLGVGSYRIDWFDPRNGGGLIAGGEGLAGGSAVTLGPPPSEPTEDWVALVSREVFTGPRVLVFTETAGFVHANQITAGIAMFEALGIDEGFEVILAEDSAPYFELSSLSTFDAVVFLNTTGDVLNASEEAAFENYIAGGGVYLGVHSATDTEYGWAFYGSLLGTWFSDHPPGTSLATLNVTDATHASTVVLPASFSWTDEWYNFQSNPADDPTTQVLLTIDESTYAGGTMGDPHPMTWAREFGGGRAWYTALGHNVSAYSEPFFVDHIRGAITWALDDPANETFRRGDVNLVGAVDIADALSELSILFAAVPPLACDAARDVNDDGANDIADPVALLGYLFSGGAAPVAPFPNCGVDPTPTAPRCVGVPCP